MDTLVIATTADEYEFILAVADTAAELERMLHLKKNVVNAAIHKNASGKICGMRFYRVNVDFD